MRLYYFSCLLVFLTWVLLWIGGLVNPMGASLACPDWYFVPTCNGELLPAMTGGVLFEHGHRLWASMVGLLTVILAVGIWVSKKTDKQTRILAIIAVLGVALQGTLGGVTVLLGLSAALSTLHLVVAMGFFCLLIYLAIRLRDNSKPVGGETGFFVAFVFTFVQILLGGLIRHVGAGMACGNDWLSCGPSFWPSWHLGQLHMLHRLIGYALAVVIGWVCIKQFGKISWAIVPIVLVFCQIGLGLWTVGSLRSAHVVAMHTAVGALILGSLWVLYWRGSTKRLST
ncbi:MAG: COX15/CtaA family protein [Myxococcaceae bacterium]